MPRQVRKPALGVPGMPSVDRTELERWDVLYRNGDYLKRWEYDLPSQELVTLLACGRLGAGSESLDLGCGTGTEAIYLAGQGFASHGIDLSPVALALAYDKMRRRGVRVEFRQGTVLDLPYPDGKFHFLNDRGCLHLIDASNRARYASAAARVLRPGGLFLLRGADETAGGDFVPLRQDELQELFGRQFKLGPIQPLQMVSNATTVPALLAVLERK